jgi:hypothetical protein
MIRFHGTQKSDTRSMGELRQGRTFGGLDAISNWMQRAI